MDISSFDRFARHARRALAGAALAAVLGGVGASALPAAPAAAQPAPVDSDGDGLYDEDEQYIYGTDPYNPDTDGDGRTDGQEIYDGTDPRSGLDVGGGAGGAAQECAYCEEYEPGGDTTCWACLAAVDSDGDGLSDLDEAAAGTDPTRGDTDGDGHGDATEVLGCKGGFPSNPRDPASWPVCGLN